MANEQLSHYSTSLTVILLATVGTANVDRHKDIDKSLLSISLIELEKRIREEEDTLQAIVFVETKVSADRLTERLRTQFPNLNPQAVIGHAGMTIPKQRQVIEEFRSFAEGWFDDCL